MQRLHFCCMVWLGFVLGDLQFFSYFLDFFFSPTDIARTCSGRKPKSTEGKRQHVQNDTINLFLRCCALPLSWHNPKYFFLKLTRKDCCEGTRIWNALAKYWLLNEATNVVSAEFASEVFCSRETALQSQPYTALAEPVLTLQ